MWPIFLCVSVHTHIFVVMFSVELDENWVCVCVCVCASVFCFSCLRVDSSLCMQCVLILSHPIQVPSFSVLRCNDGYKPTHTHTHLQLISVDKRQSPHHTTSQLQMIVWRAACEGVDPRRLGVHVFEMMCFVVSGIVTVQSPEFSWQLSVAGGAAAHL